MRTVDEKQGAEGRRMRTRGHETQERGGQRMVKERGGRSAACHSSSAWRTWGLRDSPLCPEQSSRIYINCLVSVSAFSMCTCL